MSSSTTNLGLTKLAGTENFSNANALNGNWDKIDAFANTVNPSKTTNLNGNNVTSDSTLLSLPYGLYMVSGTPASAYIPHAYGTLIKLKTGGTYGCVIEITADAVARVFVRHFTNSGWHGGWQQLGYGTWTDISSSFTINSTYCEYLEAYTDGHIVYVSMTAKTGTPDQTNLVTNIATAYRPKVNYSNLPCFFMNGIDSGKGLCATVLTNAIQLRASGAVEGVSGVKISGCYAI